MDTVTETSNDQMVVTPETKPMTAWEKADFALQSGVNRVLLHGLPGTGKTFYAMNYHTNDKPTYRLVCTQEMTDADLIGVYKPTAIDGHMALKFHEGVAIQAWRTGGRLVVDEIDRVNGDIESRLMALIDTDSSSSWQHPETGEVIKPANGFSVVATMNGEPEDLARAIQDRLIVQVQINEPHPEAVGSLPEYIRDLALSMCSRTDKDRYSLRNFVEFVRAVANTGNIQRSAEICLPRIAEQVVDAMALAQMESL